jgi:hypothetical protein
MVILYSTTEYTALEQVAPSSVMGGDGMLKREPRAFLND